jgi:hypothetical protein
MVCFTLRCTRPFFLHLSFVGLLFATFQIGSASPLIDQVEAIELATNHQSKREER